VVPGLKVIPVSEKANQFVSRPVPAYRSVLSLPSKEVDCRNGTTVKIGDANTVAGTVAFDPTDGDVSGGNHQQKV
jgi:hypothetical protein